MIRLKWDHLRSPVISFKSIGLHGDTLLLFIPKNIGVHTWVLPLPPICEQLSIKMLFDKNQIYFEYLLNIIISFMAKYYQL